MISDDVVIMTKAEFKRRLEEEFQRGIISAIGPDQSVSPLPDDVSGIAYSSDGKARISVKAYMGEEHAGHLTIGWHNEKSPGLWYEAAFSPVKARMIARWLHAKATLIEQRGDQKS